MSETDWAARFAALTEMDGDAWDAEAERLEDEWRAAYERAFIKNAVSRGWATLDAATWPDEIGGDAYIFRTTDSPEEMAKLDVIQCEEEP